MGRKGGDGRILVVVCVETIVIIVYVAGLLLEAEASEKSGRLHA
jgi:hypothetical protein